MRAPCWTLSDTTDGVGVFPQHQEMGRGYDYDAADSVHKLPYDAIPSFEPNFNTVIVHGHAKLTDLLSSAPIIDTGFLISSRLRAVFEEFALPPHRYYSVPMRHRNKPVAGYFWLQLPGPCLPLTEKSSVAEAEATISAASDLASLDLLRLYRPSRFSYCFVSDPLRRSMESAGITGVRFGTAKLFRAAGGNAEPGTAVGVRN
jgi:hypothetical protein